MLYLKNLNPEIHKAQIEKKMTYDYYEDFWKIELYYLGDGDNILPTRSKKNILEIFKEMKTSHRDSMRAIENYFDFLKAINPNEYIVVID